VVNDASRTERVYKSFRAHVASRTAAPARKLRALIAGRFGAGHETASGMEKPGYLGKPILRIPRSAAAAAARRESEEQHSLETR